MMQLHEYEEVVLLAWSFGVWMAAQVCTWQLRAGCSDMIALAGTLKPVDAQLGLAPEQFEAVVLRPQTFSYLCRVQFSFYDFLGLSVV